MEPINRMIGDYTWRKSPVNPELCKQKFVLMGNCPIEASVELVETRRASVSAGSLVSTGYLVSTAQPA